jgi:hypothetical protein
MEMYDNENTVKKSFDADFLPEELLQAQWAEFIELKKVITEIYRRNLSPIHILDIGIGNARIARHLCGVKEIWDMIAVYDGTDNAEPCIDISNAVIKELNIADKVSAHFFDAVNLAQWNKKYDLIITTWFTAGNFYPDDFDFENYQPGTLDLSANKKFDQIFSAAYSLLNPGGEIVIGACYIDTDNTRKKQESFYKKMGMTVITDERDSFTATKERFWSQRFTEEKLKRYLSFAESDKIRFTHLDTYDFARQVIVSR